MACPSLFLFSSCGSLLCALTPFIPNASLFWALQYPMLDSPKPPPHLICTPAIPLTRHRHILYSTHHARVDTLCIHILSYCITASSLAVSICVPFFISRSFRLFFPNSTLPCSRLCLSFLSSLAFVDILICALLSLSLPLFFYLLIIAPRDR